MTTDITQTVLSTEICTILKALHGDSMKEWFTYDCKINNFFLMLEYSQYELKSTVAKSAIILVVSRKSKIWYHGIV